MRKFAVVAVAALALAGTAIASPIGRPLRALVLGTSRTCDQVFQGQTPTAIEQFAVSIGANSALWSPPPFLGLAPATTLPTGTGKILCTTGTNTADFELPSATQCGTAVSSNAPLASGQILCSSAAGAALFEAPGSCAGVAVSSNTPSGSLQPLCGTGVGTASFASAVSCDLAVSTNAPTATGDVLCATSSTAAAYETPATCNLDALNVVQTIASQKTFTAQIIANGGIKIGSAGTAYTNVHENSGTWTQTISANTCVALTYQDTTANIGDICYSSQADVSTGTILTNGLTAVCAVTGNGTANNVSDVFCNSTTSSKSISTYHFRDIIFKH